MASFALVIDDQTIPFPSGRFVIGSDDAADLAVEGPGVLPQHAEFFEDEGTWWVRDLSGSGTVRVNGYATLESQVQEGAVLRLGDCEFVVREVVTTVGASAVKRSRTEVPVGETRAKGTSTPVANKPLAPGDRIDRYKVIGKLAAGGMGEVYRAEHVELGKPVAIKLMLRSLSSDGDFVARFKREAVAASQIGHPNIVDISDFGRTTDGRFYFAMELLEGSTLSRYVKDEGAFTPDRAAKVMLQIARAIAAAHAKGIIHRDLKPENVMLLQRSGQRDFVKVLDFGIAKVNEQTAEGGGLTQVGMVVGTPQYMSPEQAAGLPVDARADLYALGLIFYELIAGRPAFKAASASALMMLQMMEEPRPLEEFDASIPASLVALIKHLLAKRVHERLESADALVTQLETHLGVGTGMHRAPGAAPTQPLATPLPTRSAPVAHTRASDSSAPPAKSSGSNAAPLTHDTTVDALPGKAAASGPRGAAIAVLLLGLVLVGAGGAYLATRPGDPPPVARVEVVVPPSPAPVAPVAVAADVPPQVKLVLESEPPGAEVFEDDVIIGTTPTSRTGAQGTVVTLRFELKGYLPLVRKIRLEEARVSIPLEKEPMKVKPVGKKNELRQDPYGKVEELKLLPD